MRNGSSYGFTLLELLLAVALLAVVAATVFASFRATTSAIDRATLRGASAQAARVVLSRLSDELTAAEWDEQRDETFFTGATEEQGGGSIGRLQFTSRSHVWYPTQPPAVELAVINYQAESGPHGVQLWREEQSNPFLLSGGLERVMMADGLAGVEFRFYAKGEWATAWNTTDRHALPDLVELVLTFAETEGSREEFRTLVSLPTKGF
ncbi:MAG: prepilin-type N-terminal cleavage/methylation domain-containing protein [Nitrospirae bacterium]|nr:prepilin-type N-terminal cleavage/methylation domain-containing protein [Nitrospirota bacterium]